MSDHFVECLCCFQKSITAHQTRVLVWVGYPLTLSVNLDDSMNVKNEKGKGKRGEDARRVLLPEM
jgi:hypothetical protein